MLLFDASEQGGEIAPTAGDLQRAKCLGGQNGRRRRDFLGWESAKDPMPARAQTQRDDDGGEENDGEGESE